MSELRPYQLLGAEFLAARPFAYLGDDPGLGKTATALEAMRRVMPPQGKALVVCPASARLVWAHEAKLRTPEFPVHVQPPGKLQLPLVKNGITVVSYNGASSGRPLFPEERDRHIDVLVCDEAHYLTNLVSKRTQAIVGKGGLAQRAMRTWFLSGTPWPNGSDDKPNPWEFAPLMYASGVWRQSIDEYRNTFCFGEWRDGKWVVKGSRNIPLFRRLIEPWFLRRSRRLPSIAKQLPPLTLAVWPLDPTAAEAAAMREANNEAKALGLPFRFADEASAQKALARAERELGAMARLRHAIGVAKVKPALKALKDELEAVPGKILVFTWHQDVMDAVAAGLAKYGVVCISGATNGKDREAAVAAFMSKAKSSPRVFIGQMIAAGTALTLTAADRVFVLEPSWVPADNTQALLRAHRLGQEKNVTAWFFTLDGTLDDGIMRVISRKTRKTLETLMD